MDRLPKFPFLFLLVVVIVEANEDQIWARLSSPSMQKTFGKKIDGEVDFEVVHPVRLDDDGEFMTHDVQYVTTIDDAKASTRRRRHVDLDSFLKRTSRLFYKIPLGSEIITLNVTENQRLLRDDFVVERMKPQNGSTRAGLASSLRRGTEWPCHFRGHVEGQPGSRVALSTCHGLTGLIITEKGDYFIEPLTIARVKHDPIQRGQNAQPHKIYRRDLAAVRDRAEPLLDLMKTHKAEPSLLRENGEGQQHRHDRGSVIQIQHAFELGDNPLFEESQEFCGVTDTRRKYRRVIKKREQWEAKRERSDGARSKRSTNSRRRKRSVSVERMIEMLVVVDKKMVDYYEAYDDGNVERYVLTIINMVSELFHDASIGNSLHVSLVRLILLEEEEAGLKISRDAEKTLDSFCKWAKKINPKGDDHPNHHDVAVLLTRRDICGNANKSCETLGLAHVAGMCQSHRSCNVNQDTGLSLAFTVAHELGHNFAMHHDGQTNECKSSSAKYNHVMAPHLTSSSMAMRWSPCSRRYITRFLDRNWGFCLNDEPAEHEFEMPTTLPGVIYDADHQCRLMFGETSRHCSGIDDVCHRLWCFVGGTCRSRMHAAASGTSCAKGKWCFDGKCVAIGKRPHSVDGGWGDWTEWNSCSRTCGMGVSYSMRHCDNPTPRGGGKYCLGERKRYKTCSKWKCRASNDTRSFREQQCAAFDNVKYRNRTFSWKPVESPLYPCELHCYTHAGKTAFADRLSDKVVDGTKCFPGSNDICVDGICRRVGCDKNIGSRAMEDRCGVCHGDGTSCYGVKKIFSRKKGEEYSPVALLPRGARNIDVEEMTSASNFLALRHASNKTHYYLNGNYMIQWDTKFQLAGTQFTYRRINETRDVISSPGPLRHQIMVMILYVEENPGIEITYTAPYDRNKAFPKEEEFPEFTWKIKDWSECSQKCGKGHQISAAYCDEKKAGPVEDFFCNATLRPKDSRRSCNDILCPPRWWSAPWQPCSVTCGARVGAQHRLVICVRSVGEDEQITLNHSDCSGLERPTNKQRCTPTTEIPCPKWRAEEWQECSATCGGGATNRAVQCVTYIMNDVIDLGDVENDILDLDLREKPGRKKTRPPPGHKPPVSGDRKHAAPKLHGIKISNEASGKEKTLNGMGLMMSIEVDPIRYELDNELDGYDVEDDDLCNLASRPRAQKECNTFTCPMITSAKLETEVPTDLATEHFTTDNNVRETGNHVTTDERYLTTPIEEHLTLSHVTPNNVSSTPDESGDGGSNTPEQNLPAGLFFRNMTVPSKDDKPDLALTPDSPLQDEFDTDVDETALPKADTKISGRRDKIVPELDELDVGDTGISSTTTTHTISTTERTTTPPSTSSTTADNKKTRHAKRKRDDVTEPADDKPTGEKTEPSPVPDEFDIGINKKTEVPALVPIRWTEKKEGNKNSRKTDIERKKDQGTKWMDRSEINEDAEKLSTTPKQKPTSRRTHATRAVTSSPTTTSTAKTTQQSRTTRTNPTTTKTTTKTTSLPTTTTALPLTTSTPPRSTTKTTSATTTTTTSLPTTTAALPATTTAPPPPTTKTTLPSTTTTSLPTTTTLASTTTTSVATTTTLSPTTKSLPTTTTTTTAKTTTTTTTSKYVASTTKRVVAEWVAGNWSKCSTTCGVGANIRRVHCSAGDENLCRKGDRPPPAQRCNLGPCAKWVYGEWRKCSTLCGVGTRVKNTECVDEQTKKVLRPHHCRDLPTLTTVRVSCRETECRPWKTSRWTSCSKLCGPGTQRRRTACSRFNQCDPELKPRDRKSCFLKKCVQWQGMEWNKCSVHCGGGLQRRNVICVEEATGETTNSSYCVSNLQPKRLRKCNVHQCPAADYDFTSCEGDRLSSRFCLLLRNLGRCVQPSLAIQCCVTCAHTYQSVRHKAKIS